MPSRLGSIMVSWRPREQPQTRNPQELNIRGIWNRLFSLREWTWGTCRDPRFPASDRAVVAVAVAVEAMAKERGNKGHFPKTVGAQVQGRRPMVRVLENLNQPEPMGRCAFFSS